MIKKLLLVLIILAAPELLHAQTYYGTKWGADELANTQIGPNIQGSYRFRATHSGTLTAIHTYWQTGVGYSAGTGGTYKIEIQTDDGTANHFPTGTVLATKASATSPAGLFTTDTFASPATLTSGTLYHVVYTNTNGSPSVNYTSLDLLWLNAGGLPMEPTIPDTDWAHLYNGGTIGSPAWHWRRTAGGDDGDYIPILELVFGDGTITGNGYMESWINTSRKNISGVNQVRENFTVSGGDQLASAFSVRMRKASGTDPLTVTLKNGAGTTIESGTIANGSFSASDAWVTYTFGTPRTLSSGTTYNIILSAPGTSSFNLFPIREGVSFNFDSPTFFADGNAQFSTNTGSTWSTTWPDESANPSTQADIQFYFTINPPPAVASGYYGTKWGADELANTQIGPNVQGDYRFRSTHSGTLSSIHTYWQTGMGYSGGTLGTFRIDLESDDGTSNHYPTGTVLATTTETNPGALFLTETFSSPATIVNGVLYHLVYTNTDGSPSVNYSSLDMLWLNAGPTPSEPTISDVDWAHLYNANTIGSPTWHWRHTTNGDDGDYIPTLELVYGDGTITGNGYMESWINTSRENVSGANQARETITVSGGNEIVSTFSVRMRKDSGTDPLTVTLKTGAGATVETGTIPAGSFSASDAWVTYTFSTPRTLTNTLTYNVVLSTPGTSSYSLFPLREGLTHNFDAPSVFADGHAQLSTDTGSTWSDWPNEDAAPSTEGDLQFYFTVAGASAAAPTGISVIILQ